MSTGAQRTPSVSVVIRCRDEAGSLGPVLEAVLGQDHAPPFEVIALDSGSRDGTLVLLSHYAVRIEHLGPKAFTYGRGLNRGAALSSGEVVVYLSAHCRPSGSHWLARLVEPFNDPAVVATFGRQVPVPGVNPIEAITTIRNFPAAAPARVAFSTANGAVRRSVVLAHPFDEEIAIAEDHVWAWERSTVDRIVYVPAAVVTHSHPMSGRHWRDRFYAHGLACEYARQRWCLELPWREPAGGGRWAVAGRARAFARLAARLVRDGEVRALAHLPSYAIARTFWFARGIRDGARRYRTKPRSERACA